MANSNFPASLRLQYHLINTFVKGDSLSPYLEEALPFCPFGTFPHTVGNHPLRRVEPARPQSPAACNCCIIGYIFMAQNFDVLQMLLPVRMPSLRNMSESLQHPLPLNRPKFRSHPLESAVNTAKNFPVQRLSLHKWSAPEPHLPHLPRHLH